MNNAELIRLRDEYPNLFDNPDVLPPPLKQIVLFVEYEVEQEEGGSDGRDAHEP